MTEILANQLAQNLAQSWTDSKSAWLAMAVGASLLVSVVLYGLWPLVKLARSKRKK